MPQRLLAIIFLTSAISLWLLPAATQANNGIVAAAYATQTLTIDGDLSDWPATLQPVALDRASGASFTTTTDFAASLRVAFNPSSELLYVAVTVTDDHVFDGAKDSPWYARDCLVLYLNVPHLKSAPGVAMIVLDAFGAGVVAEPRDSDPYHTFLTKESVTLQRTVQGNQQVYEAAIHVPGYLQPNRTLGFDAMVVDCDSEEDRSYINWGPGGFKEYKSGQLADLMLLNSGATALVPVSGTVTLGNETPGKRLTKLMLTSATHTDLWVITDVDSAGNFSVLLPPGSYVPAPGLPLTNPFAQDGYDNQLRITALDMPPIDAKPKRGATRVKVAFGIAREAIANNFQRGILHQWTPDKDSAVSGFVDHCMRYYNIPGATVALIRDGEVVYSKAFGVQNTLSQQPVTDKTLFQAASVTKPVFAFIVHRLAERGTIDLDTPLHEYLPFENIAHDERSKKLTARLVLTHQSGLANWAFGGPGGAASGTKTELLFEPGAQYGYSGEAFEYLGRVVEHLTKKDLNTLLREEVLEPLNLPPLYFAMQEGLEVCNGHEQHYPHFWGQPDVPGVAHSMLTNAPAFAEFVIALDQRQGLKPATYDQFFDRALLTPEFDSPDSLYWNIGMAQGIFVQDTPYGRGVVHGGNNGNYQGEFVLYTEAHVGFVVFTNSNTGHKLGQALGAFLLHGREKGKN